MNPSVSIPAQPAPGRLLSIDGLRGAFLILMTLTHITVPGGSVLKALHPDTISFIDSATGFVFLSGLMAGLVYAGTARRRGLAQAARRMETRAAQLYGYALGLIALIALTAWMAPYAAVAWSEWAGALVRPDLSVLVSAALLLQEASFADVLPMYAVFLALGPLAIWMCQTGRTSLLLAGSTLVWAATQLGATAPVTAAVAHGLAQVRPDLALPDAFNLFGWQILFVWGLAAGAAAANGRLTLAALARPEAAALFWLCLAATAAMAATVVGLRLHHLNEWAPGSLAWVVDAYTRKERLGIGCLVNFIIFAYPVTWMLAAGVRARGASGALSRAFAAVVQLPFLRLLGRHSLQVYAWQVVLIYGVKILDGRLGASSPILNAGLILGCMALLSVPALLRERRAAGARSGRGLSAAAPVAPA